MDVDQFQYVMKNDQLSFSVYYTYRAEIAFCWQVFIATIAYIVLKKAVHPNVKLEQFPLLGFLLIVGYLVCGLNLLSHLWHNWPYTAWAQDRRPYLVFNIAGVTVFGESWISWSDISDISAVEVPSKKVRAPAVTYLILVLVREKRANMLRVQNIERFRRENEWIIKYKEGKKLSLRENEFLSLEIAAPMGGSLASHLSAGRDEIVDAAKRFLGERRENTHDL